MPGKSRKSEMEQGVRSHVRAYQPDAGGHAVGSSHGRAKLTEEAVREARRLYMTGTVGMKDIADVLGVSLPTMAKALTGQTWSHVVDVPPVPLRNERKNLDLKRGAEFLGLTQKKKG